MDIATTALGANNGSVIGGHGSAQNTASWKTVSLGTYQGYLIDGNGLPSGANGSNGTGASDLTLPFVSGTTNAVQVIRRPPTGEIITSVLGQNREANLAQIRILLSDTEAGLHLADWNGNAAQDYSTGEHAAERAEGTAAGQCGRRNAAPGRNRGQWQNILFW